MFQSFLKQHNAAAWQHTVERLLPDIHKVDRAATQIWFHFFPLELAEAIAETDDLAQLILTLRLEGNFRLADQVDSSHWFLYGSRYWPQVKAAIIARAESSAAPSSLELSPAVREIAGTWPRELVLGIAAVGLMTLNRLGCPHFAPTVRPRVRLKPDATCRITHRRRRPSRLLRRGRRTTARGSPACFAASARSTR